MALKAFPHVQQVGEPTRGCLSAFLNKWIPNGFHFDTFESNLDIARREHRRRRRSPAGRTLPGCSRRNDIFDSYPKAMRRTIDLIRDEE